MSGDGGAASGPNMGAILSSQSGASQGKGMSGFFQTAFGQDSSGGNPFLKEQDFLSGMAGNIAFLNFGKTGADSGLLASLFAGLDFSKETAFKFGTYGAGAAMAATADASSSGEASSGSSGGGSNHAFPTTMGAAQGMQESGMSFAGLVEAISMGGHSPDSTPGVGAGRGAGMGMGG